MIMTFLGGGKKAFVLIGNDCHEKVMNAFCLMVLHAFADFFGQSNLDPVWKAQSLSIEVKESFLNRKYVGNNL